MNENAEVINMGTGEKINIEMAEKEFERWAEAWDIYINEGSLNSEAMEELQQHKDRFINAIQKGRAVVSDDGSLITYNLIEPVAQIDKVEMRIPKGSAWIVMDKYKDKQLIHKMNAFMGEASKTNPKIFASMDGRDIKFFQSITAIFLGS